VSGRPMVLAPPYMEEFSPPCSSEIHVFFGDEFEGAGGGGGLAGALFGHAFHGVGVAEGGGVAKIAVETAAVDFG
jgi:hypothetical protein